MEIESAKLVYFSPTRTTQQVLEGIVRGLEVEQVAHLDLTLPQAETRPLDELYEEMALLGAPVYGGRIPLEAERRLRRLRRLRGNRTPAVIVVVYGNRAYEDALLELRDLAVEAGFVPVAGAAFVGEHSFSTDARPVAHGRPDGSDLRQAAAFGQMIRAKMRGLPRLEEMPLLHVPGHAPPKERGNPWGISPPRGRRSAPPVERVSPSARPQPLPPLMPSPPTLPRASCAARVSRTAQPGPGR